ncbi:PREDICTED: uncharacterized protein LOC101309509 [Fragaria vesca subsp. vesca]
MNEMIQTRSATKRNRQQNISTSVDDQTCYGCWQHPPEDIMQKILQHMSLDDRLRLSFVCKYWQSFATRRDMPSGGQLPWLVLPQPPNSQFLSFANLSKREVVWLNMPKPVKGVCFHASSRGWLILFRGRRPEGHMFMINPLSGVQHNLPALKTIVTFRIGFRKWREPQNFVTKIALSSPNTLKCIVAAFFSSHELGFCRPGDKRWIVFELKDNYIGVTDIFFSGTTLYALLRHNYASERCTVVSYPITFEDHVVELKLIYDEIASFNSISYMIESSINNEVLLIHQMLDRTFINDEPGSRISSVTTSGFIVYKIDVECGNFLRVQSLEDETLFLAENGSSLSFRASDHEELLGNCIYFVQHETISILYLDTGKTERLFPDVVNLEGQKGWFTPSLW